MSVEWVKENKEDSLDAEVKTDYKMMSEELIDQNKRMIEEIETLKKHISYLQEETNNTPVGLDYEKEYMKLRGETHNLIKENSRLTKALINLAENI